MSYAGKKKIIKNRDTEDSKFDFIPVTVGEIFRSSHHNFFFLLRNYKNYLLNTRRPLTRNKIGFIINTEI